MADNSSVIESGESSVCNQSHTFVKTQSDQSVNTQHQLLHTRGTFTSLIPNHNNISRYNISCLNCFKGRTVSFKDLRLPFQVFYLFVDSRRSDDGSIRRQIAPQNLKTRLMEKWTFQRMNDLIFLGVTLDSSSFHVQPYILGTSINSLLSSIFITFITPPA